MAPISRSNSSGSNEAHHFRVALATSSELIEIADRLAEELKGVSDPNEIVRLYKKCLQENPQLDQEVYHTTALNLSNLGCAYESLNEYEKASKCHEQSLKIRRQLNSDASRFSTDHRKKHEKNSPQPNHPPPPQEKEKQGCCTIS